MASKTFPTRRQSSRARAYASPISSEPHPFAIVSARACASRRVSSRRSRAAPSGSVASSASAFSICPAASAAAAARASA